MPGSLEQITAINESVSGWLHAFYAILYVFKVLFNVLLHSFQIENILKRKCTKSGRTRFADKLVLKEIPLGLMDVG